MSSPIPLTDAKSMAKEVTSTADYLPLTGNYVPIDPSKYRGHVYGGHVGGPLQELVFDLVESLQQRSQQEPDFESKLLFNEADQFVSRNPGSFYLDNPLRKQSSCTGLRIKHVNNWNLVIFLSFESCPQMDTIDLNITYSLNKFLTSCFDLPKKHLFYATVSPFHWNNLVLSSDENSDQIPQLKFKNVQHIVKHGPQLDLKSPDIPAHFTPSFLDFMLEKFTRSSWTWADFNVLTDFVFLECKSDFDLSNLVMRFAYLSGKAARSGDFRYEATSPVELSNAILVGSSKQSKIWAVPLFWKEPDPTVKTVKKYIRKTYEYFSATPRDQALENFKNNYLNALLCAPQFSIELPKFSVTARLMVLV